MQERFRFRVGGPLVAFVLRGEGRTTFDSHDQAMRAISAVMGEQWIAGATILDYVDALGSHNARTHATFVYAPGAFDRELNNATLAAFTIEREIVYVPTAKRECRGTCSLITGCAPDGGHSAMCGCACTC